MLNDYLRTIIIPNKQRPPIIIIGSVGGAGVGGGGVGVGGGGGGGGGFTGVGS